MSLEQDVDLAVFTLTHTQEELKQILVRADSRFYLVRSRSRFASYRVLWYRLSPGVYPRPLVDCKVDVVRPGTLSVPHVPAERLVTLRGLPVMPLVPQLLLKLQGWTDHRDSHRADMRAKMVVDVVDIDALLDIAVERRVRVRDPEVAEWLPDSMILAAERRLRSYTALGSRSSSAKWRELGLAV